jgi:serine/threonine protein phosphatase 1
VEGILDYIRDAPLYETVELNGRKYVLVHAGLGNFDPAKPLEDYDLMDLLWSRPSLDTQYYEDATVIFGHTPTLYYGEEFKDRAIKKDSWICIDTGVSFGRNPMLLRLDDMKEFYTS